jgi:hypothetical protein
MRWRPAGSNAGLETFWNPNGFRRYPERGSSRSVRLTAARALGFRKNALPSRHAPAVLTEHAASAPTGPLAGIDPLGVVRALGGVPVSSPTTTPGTWRRCRAM